jgi:hypothetical protein
MDYPKSVPSAGLVDGRFVDEDLLTGKPGSLIPASWGNGVTQELLSVIRTAGIAPAEAKEDQLLTALRGNKLFTTPPQFTSDPSVATAEFVVRSGLQFSGFNSFFASAALTTAHVGGVVSFYSAAAVTATLPAIANPAANGSSMHLVNLGAGVLTINAASNERIVSSNNTVGSLKLGIGDSAHLIRVNGDWRLYGGSVSDRFASAHSGVYGNVGYQRYASGNIDQWGVGTTNANGDVDVIFPISFPTAYSSIVATHVGGDGAMVLLVGGTATQQGCRLRVRNFSGQASAGWSVNYFAKGY